MNGGTSGPIMAINRESANFGGTPIFGQSHIGYWVPLSFSLVAASSAICFLPFMSWIDQILGKKHVNQTTNKFNHQLVGSIPSHCRLLIWSLFGAWILIRRFYTKSLLARNVVDEFPAGFAITIRISKQNWQD